MMGVLQSPQISVLLLISTNSAARVIGGDTIYSKMRIDHETFTNAPLNRAHFANIQLVVIDEVFILPAAALTAVDKAIRTVRGDSFFGGIEDQWTQNKFILRTLTSNMRQQGDLDFRKRLDRWAKGEVTTEDI
ncbi:unnamed protein product [Caenorhabditis brenneri]